MGHAACRKKIDVVYTYLATWNYYQYLNWVYIDQYAKEKISQYWLIF